MNEKEPRTIYCLVLLGSETPKAFLHQEVTNDALLEWTLFLDNILCLWLERNPLKIAVRKNDFILEVWSELWLCIDVLLVFTYLVHVINGIRTDMCNPIAANNNNALSKMHGEKVESKSKLVSQALQLMEVEVLPFRS